LLVEVHQDQVRKHANEMMGRTRNDEVKPAPEEAVLKFKDTGNAEDGPSKDLFQADLSESRPANSPWNLRLAEIFVDDYVQKGLPVTSQVKDLSKYFMSYLQTLYVFHRKMTTAATSGGGTAHEEAQRRSRIEKRRKTVSSRSSSVRPLTHLINTPAMGKPVGRFRMS